MSDPRPSLFGTTGAVLASLIAGVFGAPAASRDDATLGLIHRSEAANAALMRGDTVSWERLSPLSDEFTLMSPFGGTPSRRADYTPERIASMGRLFRSGTLRQELVASYASEDMVVLALIEHAHVAVGGMPAQPWGLRVTLVYRREAGAWRLAHRHADPLAAGISQQQAARLGRGERD